jgi:hypothetical protein
MARPQSLLVVAGLLAAIAIAQPSIAAPKEKDDGPTFDRDAAASALSSVDLQKCKAPNARRGEGHVTVTFAPAGAATTATVDRGPMVGTPVQKCIEAQYKKAKVPAFKGSPVNVGKSFRFE